MLRRNLTGLALVADGDLVGEAAVATNPLCDLHRGGPARAGVGVVSLDDWVDFVFVKHWSSPWGWVGAEAPVGLILHTELDCLDHAVRVDPTVTVKKLVLYEPLGTAAARLGSAENFKGAIIVVGNVEATRPKLVDDKAVGVDEVLLAVQV